MNEEEKNKQNSGNLSEEQKLKQEYPPIIQNFMTNQGYNFTNDYIQKIINKLGYSVIITNRLDYYANTIPIGAFCNAISFILYGFHRCKIYSTNDTFLWGLILIFGGLGQITAGLLEYLKARTFPATVYLTYGFYCLSHYATYVIPLKFKNYFIYGINNEFGSLAFFYGAWFVIFLPIVICSLNTNAFYLFQTFFSLLFYFFRWVGEIKEDQPVIRMEVAGFFELISGFISLYICISQIINEAYRGHIIPTFPLTIDNEIDILDAIIPKKEINI